MSYRSACVVLGLLLASCKTSPQTLLDRAGRLAAEGKYGEAVILARRALQAEPNSGDALFHLGQWTRADGDSPGAYPILLRAVELLPGREAPKVAVAELCMEAIQATGGRGRGYYDQLTAVAADLNRRFPASPEGPRYQGYLALLDNRPADAVPLFQEAVRRDPKHAAAKFGLAEARMQAGDPEAEAFAKQLLAENPTAAPLYRLLMIEYIRQGRGPDIVALIESRARAVPRDLAVRMQLAAAYSSAGRAADAARTLEAILASPAEFPDGPLEVAEFHLAAGEAERALQVLDQAAARQPQRALMYRKAALRALTGRPAEAAERLKALLAANPNDIDLRALSAAADASSTDAATRKRSSDAIEALFKENPKRADLAMLAAEAAADRGDLAEARRRAGTAVILGAGFDAHLLAASIAQREGDAGAAVRLAEDALAVYPNAPAAQFLHAAATINRGDPRAAGLVRSLAGRFPDSQQVTILNAQLALRDGRFKEAIALLAPLQADPGAARVLALAHLESGNPGAAVALLRPLALQQAGDPALALSLARALDAAGDRPAAAAVLRSALAQRPDDGSLHAAAASLAWEAKDYAPAESGFREAMRIQPSNASHQNNLAYLLAEQGKNLDEALALARRATALDGANLEYRDTLAFVYLQRKEPKQAVALLTELTGKTNRPAFYFRLAQAQLAAGDSAAARAAALAAQRAKPSPALAPEIARFLAALR